MNSIHSQLPQRQVYCIKLQVTIYSLHTECVGEDDEFNTLSAAPQQRVYCIKLQINIYSLHTQCVGEDDEFNTLTAATATGLLYKASDKYILVTYRVCGRR